MNVLLLQRGHTVNKCAHKPSHCTVIIARGFEMELLTACWQSLCYWGFVPSVQPFSTPLSTSSQNPVTFSTSSYTRHNPRCNFPYLREAEEVHKGHEVVHVVARDSLPPVGVLQLLTRQGPPAKVSSARFDGMEEVQLQKVALDRKRMMLGAGLK
jgi:hypothetical protein